MVRQIVTAVALIGVFALGGPTVGMTQQQANPCAAKNPCATKPANPCAAKNPCAVKKEESTKPAAANPCAAKNPCAAPKK